MDGEKSAFKQENRDALEAIPHSLKFDLLATQDSSQKVSLKNKLHCPVVFKIKTNAPNLYQVRPIVGRIEPGEMVDSMVVMRGSAVQTNPNDDKDLKHKFLVESIELPAKLEFKSTEDIAAYFKSNDEIRQRNEKLRKEYEQARLADPNTPEPNYVPALPVNETRFTTTIVKPTHPKPTSNGPEAELEGLMAFSTEQKNKINNLTLLKERLTNEIATINKAKAQLETRVQALVKENQDLLEVSKKKGGSNLWFYLFAALFVVNAAVVVQYFMDS